MVLTTSSSLISSVPDKSGNLSRVAREPWLDEGPATIGTLNAGTVLQPGTMGDEDRPMEQPARGYKLPPYLGLGWLDEHSVNSGDRLTADYVNGEDLVYRMTLDGRQWSVEEFYRLQLVDRGDGRSWSDALATLVGAHHASEAAPPSWRRLADRLSARELTDTQISVVYRRPAPTVFYPTLYDTEIVGAWPSSLAPDLRPKSHKVYPGQPPRQAGWHMMVRHGWYGGVSGRGVTVSPCVIGTYLTPIINVEPVVDALVAHHDGFKPPARLMVTVPSHSDVVVDAASGAFIVLRDVQRDEAVRLYEGATVPART